MRSLSKIITCGALLGLSALAAAPASAAPITLVFSGLGTGIVHGNGFSNAPFSFSYVTNPALFKNVEGDFYSTYPNSAPVSVSMDGFGSGLSTNAAYFSFLPSSGILGLSDSATGNDVFVVHSDNFFSAGPIPITLADRDQYPLSPFETSIGEIQFAEIHDATFSRTTFAPVPEASSVVSLSLLLALGAGTLIVATRRKKVAV